MNRKVAIFAFRGEATCFVHALLNVLDLSEKGYDACLVIEGSATTQIGELAESRNQLASLYAKVRERGLIRGVCRACASKMGTLEAAKAQKLRICEELSGHPSFEKYLAQGYEIITI